MRDRKPSIRTLTATFLIVAATLAATPTRAAEAERDVWVISDLHMGLGYRDRATREWYPSEDFRWPRALAGFLAEISKPAGAGVDLVIAGDFLELWQPPAGVACEGPSADYGCTLDEMTDITSAIISAHEQELDDLAAFATRNGNCLYLLPGNHDSTLLLEPVWKLVAAALGADRGCVRRPQQGDGTFWASGGGEILVEHGHQMADDPNRYDEWPTITREIEGVIYVRRPWGENFVQKVFNEHEDQFPLIDNLSPKSAGAKYRLAESGVKASAAGIADFLKFNLFDTSLMQKRQALGEREPGKDWSVAQGRRLGHRLFLAALAPNDPLAAGLRRGTATDFDEVKKELDRLAREELSVDQVRALCDQLATRAEMARGRPAEATDGAAPGEPTHEQPITCRDPNLSAFKAGLFSSRKRIVSSHVKKRFEEHRMGIFVYGHTHSFEKEWKVKARMLSTISVLNSGAFQRVIDDARFLQEAESRGESPTHLLRSMPLADLPACYTAVQVERMDGRWEPRLRAWWMEEDGPGEFIEPCDARCPSVGHGC